MKKIKLFCDSSVNPQLKIGFGAFLYFEDYEETIKIQTKKFEDTSSTKIELQSFLWAMNEIKQKNICFEIYTDCQNIISLLSRKEKLESNNYITKTGKKVKNHLLYKEFFELINSYTIEFIKVKGHVKKSQKNDIDRVFSNVDKTSRKALRNYINLLNKK